MYRGFNLKLDNGSKYTPFIEKGNELFNHYKNETFGKIEKFIKDNDKIDGTKMQNNWFPKIEADIFISHSHKDENIAKGLAGWLYNEFGLEAFIDSCIWGYANNLLHEIDKKYCLNEGSTNSYNYEKRNYSTSHVHMMLSTALTMMLDNTECIFLLNTENAICTSSIIDKTESPWLYSEITLTKLLRIRKPMRKFNQIQKGEEGVKMLSEAEKKKMEFEYEVDLKHLVELDQSRLDLWSISYELNNSFNDILNTTPKFSLDILYDQNQPQKL